MHKPRRLFAHIHWKQSTCVRVSLYVRVCVYVFERLVTLSFICLAIREFWGFVKFMQMSSQQLAINVCIGVRVHVFGDMCTEVCVCVCVSVLEPFAAYL